MLLVWLSFVLFRFVLFLLRLFLFCFCFLSDPVFVSVLAPEVLSYNPITLLSDMWYVYLKSR